MHWIRLALIGIALVWLGLAGQALLAQRPWKHTCYGSVDLLVQAMNYRPDRDMHVVVVPSSRNVGGWLSR
jgi:hypothetical protein